MNNPLEKYTIIELTQFEEVLKKRLTPYPRSPYDGRIQSIGEYEKECNNWYKDNEELNKLISFLGAEINKRVSRLQAEVESISDGFKF